jgi:CheY-like chemotaxis protein
MSAVRLSVVIVDDSDINLMLFKNLVARCGDIEPLTFKHSIAGLEWCKAHGADIVVVDYMMPAPDGIEFIQRFRQLPEMGDIPVVMVTANNLVEVRYKALQAGATDFLTKPVDKNEFIARIRNMAALRRSQKLLADRAALLASEVAAATKMIAARERETIFCLAKAAEYRDPETGAHKRLAKSHSIMRAETVQNFVDVSLKPGRVPCFEGHPLVLHFVPELLDAVQFRTVGWQEVKREALLFQQGQQGLDFLRFVDGSIVQNHRQGSADAFQEETEEAAKKSCGRCLPELGREQFTRRDQRGHHIQTLSPRGRDEVHLSCLGPGAPIGLGLHKAGFIHIR